ncbi:BT4734/BF3469 family protein [Parabacteroides timonensis]|uniref:BT4734/BF3469 family protein n=1 Tax=Parabacteroides timonensis TaxID=1871013 RepID=UPI00094F03A6|nr:BT4734/BF3469 family protein [Parabacteroides timonensis]
MRDSVNQTVECTLFRTAFDTTSYTPVTLGGYFDDVVSGKYKRSVENVRTLIASGNQEGAKVCKKNLPLLVAGGRMVGGRRREHLVDYSGCVVGDLDHVSGSPSELLGRAKELPYVKAGHISPSGTGLKLFVLVDSDLEHHAQAFDVVSRLLEADLPGVKVDPSGKDPNRGCFVSYDPSAFYKEASEVVNIPVAPEKAAAFSQPEPRSLANYIDKFETGNPFSDGGRHSYVVKLASALNSAGFGESEVVAECLYRYVTPGFSEKKILTTVSDIYRRYRSAHGSNPYRQSTGEETKKSIKSLKNLTPIPEPGLSDEGSALGPDFEPGESDFPHFEKSLLTDLPNLLADTLKPAADDTEHDLMLLAALTMTSTALPGVTGLLRKEVCYAPFYTLAIGPSGSGKGCVSQVHKLVVVSYLYAVENG